MVVTTTYSKTTTGQSIANTWTTGNQLLPDVTGLTDGGYVVTYNNYDVTDGFIMLDFYDADNDVVGSYKIPYDGDTSAIGQPSVTQLANGRVLVVWDENDAASPGLKGALFAADGTIIGSEFALAGSSTIYETPDVTALSGGGYVLSYAATGNSSIRVFNNSGSSVASFAIEAITLGSQIDAVVTALNDGGFAVAFSDSSTGNNRILSRTYDADGTQRSTNPIVVDGAGENTNPAIASLENGGYAVAYVDTSYANENGTSGISLVLVNASGAPTNGPIQVNVPTTGAGQNEAEPSITVLNNGYIVVSWTYPFSGADNDIYARVFTQTGAEVSLDPDGGEFVLASSTSDEVASAVTSLLNGSFVTVWQDSDTADSSGGYIAREVFTITRTSVGDSAANTIFGDDLGDIMSGEGGNDTLWGFDGDDEISGGSGSDFLSGGGGNDTLNGGGGKDRLLGVEGKDKLTGGGGDDLLVGGDGKDRMWGDNGKDTLSGNEGNDKLWGGNGKDKLFGGKGNDKLFGNKGNDTLEGSKGDDKLDGGNGKDKLSGEGGKDKLFGGIGNDKLDGGKGNDKLSGESGKDKFVFAKNYDKDVVLDFENNRDTIQIDDNLWNGTKTVAQILAQFGTQNGADVVLNFSGGDVLTIENTTIAQLQNDIDII